MQTPDPDWKCSPKPKDLILKLVDEQDPDRHRVDQQTSATFIPESASLRVATT
jgi:hypothetical protein